MLVQSWESNLFQYGRACGFLIINLYLLILNCSQNEWTRRKTRKKSRRKFLQELGIVGIGSVLGGSAILAGINYDKKRLPVNVFEF